MSGIYLVGSAICFVLFTLIILTFYALNKNDTANNTKLLSIIIGFSVTVAIFTYGLALYYFTRNPEYLLQFILAFTLLILFPGLLISSSVSTVTISNLRQIIADA
jgi:hypothetical protein